MSEPPLKTCPRCSKDTLKKLIGTGGGVIYKGSGFYGTDYRKETDASRKAAKDAKETKEGKEEKSDAKKESTTAKKGDEKSQSPLKRDETKVEQSKSQIADKKE